ncbi:TPA: hypothetical protein ACSEHU_001753 [Streptococcus pyogenes]
MNNKKLLIEDLKLLNSKCHEAKLVVAAEYLLKAYPNAVDRYLHDDTNYGLAYHVCGTDGDAQKAFISRIGFTHEITVF